MCSKNDVSTNGATPLVCCDWFREVLAGGLSENQSLDIGGGSREQVWALRLDPECISFSRFAD